ncbi:DUF3035 domain-containing protein [Roseomonas marmotae]|uniref:DUF3035 domain-containing protein n=1 Tax=Roseomonas marmotae TaxID=2768161 RepID=A0ABS3KAQ9_9PROT|nr:DUF3035 domain-containing protein [Roseomonas marmotae]MBO1073446.1 DUF3035 domain-containing protein [Roseomonas marmotae]QTI80358.1 DUF3035 domain-containing protein [Roseomonas marmotae]
MMQPNRPTARTAALSLLLLPLLAGCGQDTARTLGFTRDAPDEFSVVTRAPLSLPPSLGELPPPRPGAPRPQELTGSSAGAAILVPGAASDTGTSTAPSSGESALVATAGGQASPAIRRQVDEESLRLEQPDRTLVDQLMFWRDAPPPGTVVDPQREAQRLRENAALGRDPDQGETAIIQRRRQGLFQSIF